MQMQLNLDMFLSNQDYKKNTTESINELLLT